MGEDSLTPACGRRSFPPVAELRARLDAGRPWGTVAIATRVRGEYRPRIRGALSFFFNESGFSKVTLTGASARVGAEDRVGQSPQRPVARLFRAALSGTIVAVFDGVLMSHIDLPDEVVRLAEAQVAAGRASSIEEVVRVGVAALEREQQRYDAKMAKLRAAIDEGDASPDAEPGVFDRIRVKYGLPSSR